MEAARPGLIPWSIVHSWCQAHGYDQAESTFLDRMLQEMDAVYLAWHDEQRSLHE